MGRAAGDSLDTLRLVVAAEGDSLQRWEHTGLDGAVLRAEDPPGCGQPAVMVGAVLAGLQPDTAYTWAFECEGRGVRGRLRTVGEPGAP